MLNFNHLLPTNNELKTILASFQTELGLASAGNSTSFAYLHSPIPQQKLVKKGETFQTIMFGGSHVETSLMVAGETSSCASDFNKSNIPLLINKQVFCETFERYLHPAVKSVALNFAYPIETTTKFAYREVLAEDLNSSTKIQTQVQVLDGILIGAPKGHTFDGMLSKTVGVELEKYILKKFDRQITVAVCNDSTALGLASIGLKEGFDWQNTIVGVVGTGTNFGFFENSKTFVNLESGNFNKFEQSRTGQIIDAVSDNNLQHWLEKEISGAYLYQHFNILAKEYSLPFHLASTQQLDQLAGGMQPEDLDTIASNDPNKQFFINQNDIPENYMELLNDAVNLARTLLKRSALLVSCKVAGLYNMLQKRYQSRIQVENQVENQNKKYTEIENTNLESSAQLLPNSEPVSESMPELMPKVMVLMEGSLFWVALDYFHYVRQGLEILGIDMEKISFEHKHRAGLFGASRLLNPLINTNLDTTAVPIINPTCVV